MGQISNCRCFCFPFHLYYLIYILVFTDYFGGSAIPPKQPDESWESKKWIIFLVYDSMLTSNSSVHCLLQLISVGELNEAFSQKLSHVLNIFLAIHRNHKTSNRNCLGFFSSTTEIDPEYNSLLFISMKVHHYKQRISKWKKS